MPDQRDQKISNEKGGPDPDVEARPVEFFGWKIYV